MQFEMFDEPSEAEIKIEDLFQAYFDCRVHKRSTASATKFEANYESELVQLCGEINSGTYQIGQSVAFIVTKPVRREVFAANFRDRIVHHLVINKINPLLEKTFIDDSYSCRCGKGSLYGVQKIRDYLKECSDNYTKDCYILKLDVQAFFMSIDRRILWEELFHYLRRHYTAPDKELVFKLLKMIIFNQPQKNCIIKGNKHNWDELPKSKSLFGCGKNKGMPIGNLTSQILANYYMSFLDNYVTQDCGVKYYGRYVDDFVIIHEDKQFLLKLKDKITVFLKNKLHLNVHPKKVYLQHYSHGVKFVGAVIKPGREYIANRTKGNFYDKVRQFNELAEAEGHMNAELAEKFASSVNSYLGFMKHYKSYNVRKKVLETVSILCKQAYYMYTDYNKVILKKKYKSNVANYVKYRKENPLSWLDEEKADDKTPE